MVGSVKRLSPSTSIKTSASRRASESDENDHQLGTVSHTPKKPMPKRYMSPTISAASKAITPTPRNKILSERNEGSESVFSYAHDKKIPILDQIPLPVNSDVEDSLSQTIPSSPPVTQCNNNEEDGLSADLSSRPYDPFTNYLSPRPRFLRYNPNRRRKVLFGGENGTLEVKHVSTASNGSDSSDSQRPIDGEDYSNCRALVSSGENGTLIGGENGTPEVEHGSTSANGSGSSDSQGAIDEEASSNCSSLVSSFSGEGPIKQEEEEEEKEEIEGFNEEMEQGDDEENEDEEDDRSWNCKGILKTLLLLVFLVFSASCISSMHSSATVQDGYYTTQNHTVEATFERKLEIGKLFLNQRDEIETGFMEVNKRAIERGIEEESMFGAVSLKKHESLADCMYQGAEAALFSIEEEVIWVEEEGRLEDVNFGKVEHTDKLKEVENFQSGETEVVGMAEFDKKAVVVVELQTGETEVVEVSEDEKKAVVDELGEVVELQTGEPEVVEVSEGEKKAVVDELGKVVELQTGETEEGSYGMVEKLEYQGIENPENIESSKEYLISSLSKEHRVASDMLNSLEKQNEVVLDSVEEVYNEEAGDMEMVESTKEGVGNFTNLAGEVITEKMNSDRTVFGEIPSLVSAGNLSKELIKHMETQIVLKVLPGLLIFSVIVASLVLGFHFRKKHTLKKDSNVKEKPCNETVVMETKKFTGKDSSLPSKPYSESVAAKRYRPVRPTWGDEEALEQIYSFKKSPSSSVHSTNEAPEEYHQSRVPRVEFLSEIVVREVSSSLRISSIKKKTNESEESNYSVSSEKKISRGNGNSVSVRAQPIHSEFSAMEFPSYGSYTTEQKIVMKKEEGRDGEVKEITTPLRRSSRIRNRSATSP
ncbi:hypothetical protein FNV43_RR06769 [Rhamnella rubrinervis]|uniref:Uncharacterized protein n=1 Tax=Rhamnella rubrinervis TaxID=2594499 RepID=A0A8K0MMA4_9ROSA|nr:hypothetical protein FNV43_RR06769 [Rhamnella rubrinervis]